MLVLPTNGTRPLVIGHRGNPGNPLNSLQIENTIPSFESAISVGADGCEWDVESACDLPILFDHHDDTFGRVFIAPDGDNTRLVSSYSWADIQRAQLNIPGLEKSLEEKLGHPVSLQHHAGIKIPSLDETVRVFDKDKLLFIEVKVPEDKEPTSLEGKKYIAKLTGQVVRFIEENNLFSQAYVLCFVGSVLEQVKTHNSQIHTVYNVSQHEVDTEKDSSANIERRLRELKGRYNFEVIHPPFSQVTPESIKVCHELDIGIGAWVWNESPREELKEAQRLAKAGIDKLCTNQPEQVLLALNQEYTLSL